MDNHDDMEIMTGIVGREIGFYAKRITDLSSREVKKWGRVGDKTIAYFTDVDISGTILGSTVHLTATVDNAEQIAPILRYLAWKGLKVTSRRGGEHPSWSFSPRDQHPQETTDTRAPALIVTVFFTGCGTCKRVQTGETTVPVYEIQCGDGKPVDDIVGVTDEE